ncbi:MAG: hypothetical protein ACYC6Y_26090 [Thermoguttaceae bacterium]
MKTPVHDKGVIEAFLRRNMPLHLYELGDLDERFWPSPTWCGHMGAIRVHADHNESPRPHPARPDGEKD